MFSEPAFLRECRVGLTPDLVHTRKTGGTLRLLLFAYSLGCGSLVARGAAGSAGFGVGASGGTSTTRTRDLWAVGAVLVVWVEMEAIVPAVAWAASSPAGRLASA